MKGKRVLSLALAALIRLPAVVPQRRQLYRHDQSLGQGRCGVPGYPGGGQGDQRHHLCSRPEDDRL